MPRVIAKRPPLRNLGELLDRLGNVPAWRVCLVPPPGTATSRDLIRCRGTYGMACELIDGTIVEKPPDSVKAHVLPRLIGFVGNYLHARGRFGFACGSGAQVRFGRGLVRDPDLCVTLWADMPQPFIPFDPIAKEVPVFTVDVATPDNTAGEYARKLAEYFRGGVKLAWLIDPRARTAVSYTAPDRKTIQDESGTLDGDDVLPGLRIPLVKLFARLEKRKKK